MFSRTEFWMDDLHINNDNGLIQYNNYDIYKWYM